MFVKREIEFWVDFCGGFAGGQRPPAKPPFFLPPSTGGGRGARGKIPFITGLFVELHPSPAESVDRRRHGSWLTTHILALFVVGLASAGL